MPNLFLSWTTGTCLLLGIFSFAEPVLAEMTVFVVRHAEKEEVGKDPVLTDAGTQRATDLARVLRSAKIKACFHSDWKRTKLTAVPSSKSAKASLIEYTAGKEKELVKKISEEFIDQNILVVGHSNTIPSIITLLGVENELALSENDYDNLFVVKIDDHGKSKMIQLHYGDKNPK